jgi:arylsulfatase A-like enzyme
MLYQNKAPHDLWEFDPKHASLYEDICFPEPATLHVDYDRSVATKYNGFKIPGIGREVKEFNTDTANLSGEARKSAQYQMLVKYFLRCVKSIDDNLGRILKYLDDEGLADNTVVIYTADQGYFLGEHGLWDKRLMYEESLRMPFIVRYPSEIKPKSINSDIILNVDFAPTFMDYAGVKIPAEIQGRSILPLLKGQTPSDWRTSMYYHYQDAGAPPKHVGVRNQRYKLIYYYGLTTAFEEDDESEEEAVPPPEKLWEFFDLQRDPYEMFNLYQDPGYADIVKEMKQRLVRLMEEVEDTGQAYRIVKNAV